MRRRSPRANRIAVFKSTARKRKKGNLKIKIKKQIAREAWAIILITFAAATFLSLEGAFGIIGTIWVSMLKPILGWGIYIVPALFVVSGFMVLISKKITFGPSRILGMTLFLISVLGVLHMSVPIEEILVFARDGSHGGYVGFVFNFLFREVLSIGNVGTGTVFVGMFLVSLVLTFEVSLGTIFRSLKPRITIEVQKGDDRAQRKIEEEAMDEGFWKKVTGVGGRFKGTGGEATEVEPELMIRRSIGDTEAADPDEEARKKVSENLNKKEEVAADGSVGRDGAKKDKIVVKDEEFEKQLSKGAKEEEVDTEWEFPSLDLLNSEVTVIHADDDVLKQNADKIKKKLEQFDINVVMHEVNVGPTVVQYTLKPADDVRLSKITALKADVTMALAAKSVRIEAPIPGKSLVGLEVPNENRANVHLREILESDSFDNMDSKLRLPMGRDVSGNAIVADLETMPHLLIAGATGSGKSVCINAFLLSLLYQNTPEELKLILIDPKRVELGPYNFIPYLLTPVIKDPDKAAISLRWVVAEMTRRYQVLSDAKKRNIIEYNTDDKIKNKLAKIVVIIDELADLMMASGSEVEASICRIAQMARAVGIHLIVATQRPSVDVITGLIKANIPARVAFAVSSSIDSRTILDGMGAEDLLGRGDMLYQPSGMGKPFRVQGVFVSSKEVEKVTSKIKLTYEPLYDDAITSNKTAVQRLNGVPDTKVVDSDDELYQEAFKLVQETRKASASLFQRRLKIGYARAARLVDILEEKGVVGPANGAKPREILVD